MHTTIRPPYLHQKRIEREAQLLLAEFQASGEWDGVLPAPLDRLLELHLGLTLEIEDLQEQFGLPDVLGALWVERREVCIDRRLDPDEHPGSEGRYRFTMAHEVGHWVLHRPMLLATPGKGVICRQSAARESIEWQADYFAASLLMPRPRVHAAWRERRGGPLAVASLQRDWNDILAAESDLAVRPPQSQEDETDLVLTWAARDLADEFAVSPTAMRIRLEELQIFVR